MSVLGIVPTFGHVSTYGLAAVRSFLEHTPGGTCVLVDDGSPDWPTDWTAWPALDRCIRVRFEENDRNLTRSWNLGLRMAQAADFDFAIAANSDVLFTSGWWEPQECLLTHGHDLVGPLTNAPGPRPQQNVAAYLEGYRADDSPAELTRTAGRLLVKYGPAGMVEPTISLNGFCLAARTVTWHANAFAPGMCFNPAYKLTRNDDELQGRWLANGARLAISLSSYVFHYRSVSRPEVLRRRQSRGWYRHKP